MRVRVRHAAAEATPMRFRAAPAPSPLPMAPCLQMPWPWPRPRWPKGAHGALDQGAHSHVPALDALRPEDRSASMQCELCGTAQWRVIVQKQKPFPDIAAAAVPVPRLVERCRRLSVRLCTARCSSRMRLQTTSPTTRTRRALAAGELRA